MVPNGEVFFRVCFPSLYLCVISTHVHTQASDSAQWAAEGKINDDLRLLCSCERDLFFLLMLRRHAEGCFLLRPRRYQALCWGFGVSTSYTG